MSNELNIEYRFSIHAIVMVTFGESHEKLLSKEPLERRAARYGGVTRGDAG